MKEYDKTQYYSEYGERYYEGGEAGGGKEGETAGEPA